MAHWTITVQKDTLSGKMRAVTATVRDENGDAVLTDIERSFPASMSDDAVLLSLRHEAWMTKYPPVKSETKLLVGQDYAK